MAVTLTTSTVSTSRVYDDFTGTGIDENLWQFLTIPSSGGSWSCFEPAAETCVGEGTLDIYVPRFTHKRSREPVVDNLKHQLVSIESFFTRDTEVLFAFDMATTSFGAIPTGHSDGFASFMLVDTRRGWSFCVCSQGSRDFALYDCLRSSYRSRASTRVIDTPVAATHFVGSSHHHEILIDGRNGSLDWWTDDQIACRVQGVDIPSRLNIALGVATLGSVERTVAQTYCPESGLSVSFGPVSIQGP
jgi:Family of unknown function (DUF6081)